MGLKFNPTLYVKHGVLGGRKDHFARL